MGKIFSDQLLIPCRSSQPATTNLPQQLKEHSIEDDPSAASISAESLSTTDDDDHNSSSGNDDLPPSNFENELFTSRVYIERGRSS